MSFDTTSSSGSSGATSSGADHILDTSGLYCPEPVMLLHNKIRDIDSGELLQVIATDPSTQRDIPKFCNFLGHTLVAQDSTGLEFNYFIRKA